MNKEEFTISFTNNSSIDVFPDNKLSKFRFRLNNPIDLSGEQWEVALVSFSYPNSWFLARSLTDIRAHKYNLEVRYENSKINLHSDILSRFVRAGYLRFKSYKYGRGAIRHVVSHKGLQIYEAMSTFAIPFTYRNDEDFQIHDLVYQAIQRSHGLDIVGELMGGGSAYVNSDGKVEKIVNYASQEFNLVKTPSKTLTKSNLLDSGADLWTIDLWVQGEFSSEFILPIPANSKTVSTNYLPAVFVYSDLVDFQNVGSNLKPLLGFVPYTEQDETNDVAKYEPRQRHFKRVNQGYISEIVVELKDVFDDPLDFKSGDATLELQFRKCK